MSVRTNKTDEGPARGIRGAAGEQVTVLILLAIAAFLGFLRFGILPRQADGPQLAFELRNPMLETEPGDCLRGQGSRDPAAELCFVVRQRVLRPMRGPASLVGYPELRRYPPYLIIDLHDAGDGPGGCSGDSTSVVLRSLNGFGMDPQSRTRVDSIRPVWMSFGGREDILYEVVLQRYDVPSTWIMYIAPDLPVTGLVKQEEQRPNQAETTTAWYREAECR
ncbi:MAG: hypothetical protein GY946_33600 [bacterium]|nr:hypothetical protein [bacterium]